MRLSSAAGLGFVSIAAALSCGASAATEETSCDQISKFAQERLHAGAKNLRKLETLQFPCELAAGPLPFQFLIATAPNPIETHLKPGSLDAGFFKRVAVILACRS